MKKILSLLCAMAMMVSLLVPVTAMAANSPRWEKVSGKEEWTYTDGIGTDLVAKLVDTTLTVSGTGAIPGYSRDALGNRPWHNKTVYSIVIENGVTSIGAEAFSGFKDLFKVAMPVSTFIEDASAFSNVFKGCLFEFEGMNIVSRNFGNVPYDSLDSIAAFMESYNGVYRFRMDNYYMISLVQSTVSPKIKDIAPRDALSVAYNPAYPVIDYTSTVSMVSAKPDFTMSTSIVCKQQGKAALEVFSIVLGDNTYVTAYNMSVNSVRGMVKSTATPLTYKMTLPESVQQSGRQFTLIQLGNGVVNFLADEDVDDTTLTFTTDLSTSTFALVYKDAVVPVQ